MGPGSANGAVDSISKTNPVRVEWAAMRRARGIAFIGTTSIENETPGNAKVFHRTFARVLYLPGFALASMV
jgi:uncharacterized phosphosugar-binding protein